MIKIVILLAAYVLLTACDIVGSAVLQATTSSFPLLW